MALQLNQDFETPFGTIVSQTYWRWAGLGIDVTQKQANLTLYAYVSEAAFASGKQSIGARQYQVSGPDFQALAAQIDGDSPVAISTVIYAFVKEKDSFFASAVDV